MVRLMEAAMNKSDPSRKLCRRSWLALACLALMPAMPLASERHDHGRARQALAAGDILPLRVILDRVEADTPGQVLDVELERENEDGREAWRYEIKILRPGGSRVKLKVDARDGTILSRKQRNGSRD